MDICTWAPAMAAVAAIPSENAQRLTTLQGKMLRIQIGAPGAALHDPCGQSLRGQCGRARQAAHVRAAIARRSTPGDCAIPGAGASTAATERCGSPTWARGHTRRSTRYSAEATTAGIAAKVHTILRRPAVRPRGLIDPVAEYDHSLGESITGGYVYRGSQPSTLVGRYLFADFASGRIWAWIPDPGNPSSRAPTQLLQTSLNISSFGQGNDGELYVVHYTGGTLHRINFQGGGGGGTVPATLSATGCVSPTNATQPASGLIPYAINAPFWSDNATKERWMGLPNGHQHLRRHQQRLGFPERHRADEELPHRHTPDRNAPADASPRRQLGRLHV